MKKLIAALLVTVFSLTAAAHDKRFDVRSGMSENTVRCILQDASGYMWFGTKNGLDRFDGKAFKVYGASSEIGRTPGISSLNIEDLILHTDGKKIWVASRNGLFLFDPANSQFVPFSTICDIFPLQVPVNSVDYDHSGNLWLGTTQGLYSYNEISGELRSFHPVPDDINSIPSERVIEVFCDSRGIVWVGTEEGLCRYNPIRGNFKSIGAGEKTISVLCITEDANGGIWVGTWYDGFAKINFETGNFHPFCYSLPDGRVLDRIRYIYNGEDSVKYICSDNGLFSYDEKTGKINGQSLVSDKINRSFYSFYKDREGGYWIGTYFYGVVYVSPKSQYMKTFRPVDNAAVSQFLSDGQGHLWVATENSGLHLFDPSTETFLQHPYRFVGENIHALCRMHGEFWVGTFSEGLWRISPQGKKTLYLKDKGDDIADNSVYALKKLDEEHLLVGTMSGASIFSYKTAKFTEIKELAGKFIYDIAADSYGKVWFATNGTGVFCYDSSLQEWKHYSYSGEDKEGQLISNRVIWMHIDAKEQLWLGTEGYGICRYDYEEDCFQKYRVNSPSGAFPGGIVYGILDDSNGNLWLSTNNGLICFDYRSGDFQHLQYGDGLQSNQFNYRSAFKTGDGRMYFGGIDGFNSFYPNKLYINRTHPIVAASLSYRTKSGLQAISVGKNSSIVIPRNVGAFNIKFECPSFVSPENTSYKYRLSSSSTWTLTRNNEISFANVKPGNYRFEAIAINSDGYESSNKILADLHVKPPILLSTGAILIYCMFLVMVVILIAVAWERRRKADMAREFSEMKLQHDQEAYDAKIQFFTHIAHEIKTPVTLIKAPLEIISEKKSWDEEVETNLQLINANTDRLLSLVKQLLDFKKVNKEGYKLNLENVDVRLLVEETVSRFVVNTRNIRVNFEAEEGELVCYLDPEAYTKMVSNLLNNALKYAESYVVASLEVEDTCTGSRLIFKVRDDGPGISTKEEDKVFDAFYQVPKRKSNTNEMGVGLGLSMVKLLAEKHNGKVFINENYQDGLEIGVDIPLVKHDADSPVILDNPVPEAEEFPMETETGKSMLIVEDNKDLLDFLCSNFSKSYKVAGAENGMIALQKLHESVYDLIISDISMPEMDGFELLKAVRTNKMLCHIPFVLLSAETSVESKIKGLEKGADAYIEKPFSLAHFNAVLDNLLNGRELLQKKFSSEPLEKYDVGGMSQYDSDWISKVDELIINGMSNAEFSIDKLADDLFMSRSNFQRKLKGLVNMPPNEYIRLIRLKKAAELLADGQHRINEVCYIVGFNNPSYFSNCFHKQFGMLPKDFVSRLNKKQL